VRQVVSCYTLFPFRVVFSFAFGRSYAEILRDGTCKKEIFGCSWLLVLMYCHTQLRLPAEHLMNCISKYVPVAGHHWGIINVHLNIIAIGVYYQNLYYLLTNEKSITPRFSKPIQLNIVKVHDRCLRIPQIFPHDSLILRPATFYRYVERLGFRYQSGCVGRCQQNQWEEGGSVILTHLFLHPYPVRNLVSH